MKEHFIYDHSKILISVEFWSIIIKLFINDDHLSSWLAVLVHCSHHCHCHRCHHHHYYSTTSLCLNFFPLIIEVKMMRTLLTYWTNALASFHLRNMLVSRINFSLTMFFNLSMPVMFLKVLMKNPWDGLWIAPSDGTRKVWTCV